MCEAIDAVISPKGRTTETGTTPSRHHHHHHCHRCIPLHVPGKPVADVPVIGQQF